MDDKTKKVMDALQLSIDVALESLMAAQRGAAIINAAQMEGREPTDDELDMAANARRAAIQRFKDIAGIEET